MAIDQRQSMSVIQALHVASLGKTFRSLSKSEILAIYGNTGAFHHARAFAVQLPGKRFKNYMESIFPFNGSPKLVRLEFGTMLPLAGNIVTWDLGPWRKPPVSLADAKTGKKVIQIEESSPELILKFHVPAETAKIIGRHSVICSNAEDFAGFGLLQSEPIDVVVESGRRQFFLSNGLDHEAWVELQPRAEKASGRRR